VAPLALRDGPWCSPTLSVCSEKFRGTLCESTSEKIRKKGGDKKASHEFSLLLRVRETASLSRSFKSGKGELLGFFSPLHSHVRWTPWSVLQDGTIGSMHLTGGKNWKKETTTIPRCPYSCCRGTDFSGYLLSETEEAEEREDRAEMKVSLSIPPPSEPPPSRGKGAGTHTARIKLEKVVCDRSFRKNLVGRQSIEE